MLAYCPNVLVTVNVFARDPPEIVLVLRRVALDSWKCTWQRVLFIGGASRRTGKW